ncbi:hypothetical protein SAMN06297164_3114 [Nitrosomonas ureae]|uniref:Uncharacterized protein n=2 Tax=Nitrosomonas ureae TaxID=44577 RepID=A0A286AGJ5_9PROT|nr:hypothetical protein SAMN06297164_3114 [Nitrosomonas ureae]
MGTKPIKNSKIKCFLWLPQRTMEEPHFYLFLEDYKEYKYFERLIETKSNVISLKIYITSMGGELKSIYLIKKAYFSDAKMIFVAENWQEAFIKYHFPKYALNQIITESSELENKFRFFISESELFSSFISVEKDYTGEVRREIISNISLNQEISHLGIKLVTSDKYIGENESNILEIIPHSPINSLLAFFKIIKPIVELILVLTSFAEKRRLNWYKCDGAIGGKFVENFNTRVVFYQDKKRVPLISTLEFESFLTEALRSIEFHNIKYITQLLQSYLSGIDYSINAKIVLWNSILEKILKKHFGYKKDCCKEELLAKFSVPISDLSSIRDLIDIRNDIAHGDEINSDRLFKLAHEWQILIERTLLRELKWYKSIER